MKKRNIGLGSLVWLLCPLAALGWSQDKVDFVKQIQPIFKKHCLECHGPDEENSFRIDVADDALAYVESESPDDSDLYLVTVSDDEDYVMPPPDFEHQLSDEQKATIKTWIEQGAEWPEDVDWEADPAEMQRPEEAPTQDPEAGTNQEPAPTTGDDQPQEDQPSGDDSNPAESGGDDTADDEPAPAEPEAVSPETQRIFNATGSLHPAAVHLPIGLLLGAGFFALLGIRGNFVMSDCAYYCLWLGAITAVIGCVTGWFFSPMEKKGTVMAMADLFDQDHKVFWHRTQALVVSAFALLLALFAASARSKNPDEGVMWKLGTILLAVGIGMVGHSGGELHYPAKHYEDLEALIQDMISGDQAPAEESADGDAEASGDGAADDNTSTGDDDPDSGSGDTDKDDGSQVGTTSSDDNG